MCTQMKIILKANLVLAVVFSLLFVSCSQENADSNPPKTERGKKLSSLSSGAGFGNVVQLPLAPDLITTAPQNLVWCSDYLYHSPYDSTDINKDDYGYIYYSVDTINNRLGEVYIYAPFYNRVKSLYPEFSDYFVTYSAEAINAIVDTKGWKDNVNSQNPGDFPAKKAIPLCSELSAWKRFLGAKCATGERVPLDDNSALCVPLVSSGFWFFRWERGEGPISPC